MLLLGPWVKSNSVDHTVVDTTSILQMIENRFAGGRRIGGGSFDVRAGNLLNAFDFTHRQGNSRLILDPSTGQPIGR
jgi:phospholipase C